jgi:hypothetical protein
MRNLLVAASLLAVSIATLMATTSACTPAPVSPTGEGEGEGAAAGEGEGAAASEGEGAAAGEGEGAAAGEGEGEGIIANVTWYRDVLPLARQRCELCHVDGGIGPFSMENTDSVVEEQQNIAAEVDSLLMPPWMPSADCSGHTYVGERSLNPDEKATLQMRAAPSPRSASSIASTPRSRQTRRTRRCRTPTSPTATTTTATCSRPRAPSAATSSSPA